MQPEALSRFIDELLEGKDPKIADILRRHPVGRDEFAALVRAAELTHSALLAIEIPAGAEEQSRERAVKLMGSAPATGEAGGTASAQADEGLIDRVRGLLQERFGPGKE